MQDAQPIPIPEGVSLSLRVIREFDPEMTFGALASMFGDAPSDWAVRLTVDDKRMRLILDRHGNVVREEVVR